MNENILYTIFKRSPTKCLLTLLVCVFVLKAAEDKSSTPPPFSATALQWLLEREEYDRFDWYIERYLGHHPDTAILHMLNGYRYFNEAVTKSSQRIKETISRTGGIPRKYPHFLTSLKPKDWVNRVQQVYNKTMLDTAFAMMRHARFLEPDRKDVYMGMCRMAAKTGRTDILAREVKSFVRKYGYTPELKKLIFDYADQGWYETGDSIVIHLLRDIIKVFPEDTKPYLLLRKFFFLSGNVDSAFYYTMHVLKLDSLNLSLLQKAITLATLKCDFSTACRLALKRYAISKELIDIEQATICAYAVNRLEGKILYEKVTKDSTFAKSLSLTRWLFNDSLSPGKNNNHTHFFTGDLFHLNFPLFYINYRNNQDQLTYYHHKAGAYYTCELYDSAAFYNLMLLRSAKEKSPVSYSAFFNLAAEYYASGRYLLAFQRFLWIYDNLKGHRDLAVRYALAVSYETIGEYWHAKKQYSHIIKHANKLDEHIKHLYELALHRLNNIRNRRRKGLK
jgi:hypothetical protein